jgi:hypothetical protein
MGPTTGTYDTADAGTSKAVTVTGVKITGGSDSSNYTLGGAFPTSAVNVTEEVGTIIPAPLTVGLTGTVQKVYDGTTTATLAQDNYVVGGSVYDGDTVTIGSTATYDTADQGTGKTVTVTAFSTGGSQGEDYEVVTEVPVAAPIGVITPAPLTISANGIDIIKGGTVPPFTATYTGLVDGQTPLTVSPLVLDGTPAFAVNPTPYTAVGSYTITPSGVTSPNDDYSINYQTGTLQIRPPQTFQNQEVTTVEAELPVIISDLLNNPFYVITVPPTGLQGELTGPGAINDDFTGDYLAFGSSTIGLPADSRLVTPGLGIVIFYDGMILIGDPDTGTLTNLGSPGNLPSDVIAALRSVLSPSVYDQLHPLIYGSH